MPSTLAAHDLGFTVDGRGVLRGVTLEVQAGEVLSVMGMSGSGKTTLLKCLARLHEPTEGRLEFDGVDITHLPEREMERIRLKIGMVFQYAALFDSLTVFDNVAFGLVHNTRRSRAEIAHIVERRLNEVDMADAANLMPAQLSGGMRKRIGLARALALEPTVLLYDEPTSGLDPVIARTIDDLILATRDRIGVTSVVVSHDVRSVFRISDRIAMIHQGELVAIGTPDEMRRSDHPIVRQFVGEAADGAAPTRR